jgi:hypothetical protein
MAAVMHVVKHERSATTVLCSWWNLSMLQLELSRYIFPLRAAASLAEQYAVADSLVLEVLPGPRALLL